MEQAKLQSLMRELVALPRETEWCEFKHNQADPAKIGEYVSALSNSAALHGKPGAYILWGVDNCRVWAHRFMAKYGHIV